VFEDPVLSRVRAYLLAILACGIAGTEIELLLLGHFEGLTQMLPVALLPMGLLLVGWHAVAPSALTVKVFRIVMAAFVLSGVVGLALHFNGNREFELEMYPTMAGLELVRNTMTGATPVLAPGTMTLLGFVGLMHSYRHPHSGLASDRKG
jgi:hypothetical protein